MSADLKNIHDHPALVLRGARAGATDEAQYGLQVGENLLRDYEDKHGVTFAALDNKALAAVREAHRAWGTGQDRAQRVTALVDLGNAIADLLGLED